jgi:hypothetical protein
VSSDTHINDAVDPYDFRCSGSIIADTDRRRSELTVFVITPTRHKSLRNCTAGVTTSAIRGDIRHPDDKVWNHAISDIPSIRIPELAETIAPPTIEFIRHEEGATMPSSEVDRDGVDCCIDFIRKAEVTQIPHDADPELADIIVAPTPDGASSIDITEMAITYGDSGDVCLSHNWFWLVSVDAQHTGAGSELAVTIPPPATNIPALLEGACMCTTGSNLNGTVEPNDITTEIIKSRIILGKDTDLSFVVVPPTSNDATANQRAAVIPTSLDRNDIAQLTNWHCCERECFFADYRYTGLTKSIPPPTPDRSIFTERTRMIIPCR